MLFPDAALVRRLERFRAEIQVSFAHTCARLYPGTQPAHLHVADGHAVYTHDGSPVNRAMGLGMAGPVTAAELDQVEAFYFDRGAPSQIDLTPNTHRSLVELLGQRGYRIHMFLNMLMRAVSPADEEPAPGIDVQPVPRDQLESWAALVADGFGYRVPPGEVNLSLITGSQHEGTAWLARVDGRPAGGGAVLIRGADAYLGSTSVLPDFRRRGVHTAMMQARIAQAARAGCDLVQVQTTPGGDSQRNLQRLGFQVAYTRMLMIQEKP